MIPIQKNISAERIFLIHSNDYTGHRAYYFLHVHPLKLPLFEEAVRRGANIDLDDYGDVITSGYGDAPQDVRDAISRRYGWQPQ